MIKALKVVMIIYGVILILAGLADIFRTICIITSMPHTRNMAAAMIKLSWCGSCMYSNY